MGTGRCTRPSASSRPPARSQTAAMRCATPSSPAARPGSSRSWGSTGPDGQVPDGRLHEQGPDPQIGAVPRAPLPQAAVRAHQAGPHRPELRDHPQGPARRGAQCLRDVQAQAGRLREGGAQAVNRPKPIDAALHGVVDYQAGALLTTVLPRFVGVEGTPAAKQIRVAGAAHAGYSTLTDYPL